MWARPYLGTLANFALLKSLLDLIPLICRAFFYFYIDLAERQELDPDTYRRVKGVGPNASSATSSRGDVTLRGIQDKTN